MLQNSLFHVGGVKLYGLRDLKVFSNLKDSIILFMTPCFLGILYYLFKILMY